MAVITPGNYITAPVASDMHANQYLICKLDSNGNAVLAAAATDDIVGVLDEVPQPAAGSVSGGLVTIAHVSGAGTGKVIAGGSISKGAYLTSNGSGQAVAATQASAGNQPTTRVFGRARVAANSGDVFEYEKMFFFW